MTSVRVGIVGVGVIGTAHAFTIYNGEAEGLCLSALCDNDKKRASALKAEFSGVCVYESYEEMIDSGKIDAVIIATPHYFHPIIATYAFKKGLHVLSEKPLGVYTLAIGEALLAHRESGKLYATMLNQRTNKLYMKAKELVDSGIIGELTENTWTVTNWYRTQEYYDSGEWRGTWQGEGGGVLTNQAPHNLDLWQYICGMPISIKAECYEGKHHNIEVEDEAVIYAEYANGARGKFITSTGIENGVNSFEIVGARGKITIEKGKLILNVNGETVEYLDSEYNGHLNILKNFADAILRGEKLIAPASEAINQVILCNLAYLSSWKNEKITLPLDENEFFEYLQEKVANSRKKANIRTENLFDRSYKKKWTTNW